MRIDCQSYDIPIRYWQETLMLDVIVKNHHKYLAERKALFTEAHQIISR